MVTHPLWRPYTSVANRNRQPGRVAHRQAQPGPLQPHRARWVDEFTDVRELIREALRDQVLSVNHVGSTAVTGLVAKPVLDIDLTVPDVHDELAYLPQLEAVGFRLIFRDDIGGDAHRQLTLGVPNTNLHVWSPDAVEPRRHALFTEWLRSSPVDRERYAQAKRAAAAGDGSIRYNDAKSAAIYDIYEHALSADPDHPHDPHPRT